MACVCDYATKTLPSSDNVLLEELLDDVDDIGDVHLVDETIDALLQGFPGHALVGRTGGKHSTTSIDELAKQFKTLLLRRNKK